MISLCTNLCILIVSTGLVCAQQDRISIHQEQSEYYNNINTRPKKKVKVLNGLDILLRDHTSLIRGRNIALVTNQTGVDRFGIPNYKKLMDLDSVNLELVFSPEHGIFGEAAAGEKVTYDSVNYDLPKLVSLYSLERKPSPEMLGKTDLIIYDILDIGARFYTYISTLGKVMEAAGENGIPIMVLDRPNPIRGDIIEGPILDIKFKTFVGYYPIPIRYGGTIGKLAQKIIDNNWISPIPNLTVIPTEGWTQDLWYDETDLLWVNPSPNIPNLETAIIYPGMCLIEGTNISEGRGTPHPFKWIGAPWINGVILSQELNKLNLPGVVFVPNNFTPKSLLGKAISPKYENKKCNGIKIRLTDRDNFKSVESGVQVLFAIYNLYPNYIVFKEKHLNRLWGNDDLLASIKSGERAEDFLKKINY